MDRSFLSQSDVIAASRNFVCVRLATYEDKGEADFLKSFQVTRSGELENTVFTILAPDGKRELIRASRSASHTFGEAKRMAEAMLRLGREVADKPAVGAAEAALPKVANVRLALDVAACDNRPLVVLRAADAGAAAALEKRVGQLAWSAELVGQFVYVAGTDRKDLTQIEGVNADSVMLTVQPDKFGMKGMVLTQLGPDATNEAMLKCLKDAIALHQHDGKQFANHVRDGHQKGVFWETVVPVSDPMERRARERGRSGGSPE